MKAPTAEYRVGHVIDELCKMPDESVQMVVTSPPYWGLRKYSGEQEVIWGREVGCRHEWGTSGKIHHGGPCRQDSPANIGRDRSGTQSARTIVTGPFCEICGAWKGAFGLEPSIEMYVEHTISILQEIRRVLRSDGVVFWDIGDSYAGGGRAGNNPDYYGKHEMFGKTGWDPSVFGVAQPVPAGLKPKDLCLIPFRVALAVQADGWWVRSDIIWSKPNPMPESVTDRPSRSHEYIFLFTKSKDYYWDADAIKERTGNDTHSRGTKLSPPKEAAGAEANGHEDWCKYTSAIIPFRNARTIWTINPQPYSEAHFATFPEEIPRRCILAGSRPGDMVLDPFAGSGTTLKVARSLGRSSIGIDISPQYRKLAVKRADLNTHPLEEAPI